jgi:hypothetical protein
MTDADSEAVTASRKPNFLGLDRNLVRFDEVADGFGWHVDLAPVAEPKLTTTIACWWPMTPDQSPRS